MEENKTNNLEKNWELVNFCEFDKYAIKSYCAIHDVDESLNLGDITKVDETKLNDFNMIVGGSPCFIAGTKVLTLDGYKNIEDINIGDYVLTHKNRYRSVVNIGGKHNQNIYTLKVQGFLNTECTDYHPFYCKKTKDSEPEKVKLKDIKKGYYIGSHINTNSVNKFNLSDGECWLLGRYVADGYIRTIKVKPRCYNSYHYQYILGNGSVNKLKQFVAKHHCIRVPNAMAAHRHKIVFATMKLANFIIDNNFGTSLNTKRIPKLIMDLPVKKLQLFFDGYMSANGCCRDNNYQIIATNKDLAMSLMLIIQKLYRVGCYISLNDRPRKYKIQGRIVNQRDTYMIRFTKSSEKHSWFVDDDVIWYPVKEISYSGMIADVYNIEVEEDHTYTANNMITFNCQDFSLAGKQKGSVWTCKDCGHEYNPLTVHWNKRDKCPNCSSNNIEKTRSSLLVEFLRVIRANMPNFGIYENVKNIVCRKFRDTTFKLFEDELHEYGYNTYWKVLNSKDFGVPQNRERVYLIFIKKDLDNGKFKFPEKFDNGIRLKDVLEDEVDEKYYISEEKVKKFITNLNNNNAVLYDPIQVNREGKSREYNDFAPTLTARDYKDPRIVNENAVKQVGNIVDTGNWNNPQRGRIYSADGCSPALNCCGGGGLEPKIVQVDNNEMGGSESQSNVVQIGIDKSLNDTKVIDCANCITAREDRGISNRKSEGTAVVECGKVDNTCESSLNIITATLTNKGEQFDHEIKYANTLLARDYKGFGSRGMNGIIEFNNKKDDNITNCDGEDYCHE